MPQEAEAQPPAELKQAGEASLTALCCAPGRDQSGHLALLVGLGVARSLSD